jgi:hypothetical protein
MTNFSIKKLIVLGTILLITGFTAYAFAHGGGYHIRSDNYSEEDHMNDKNIGPGRDNNNYQMNDRNGRSDSGDNKGLHQNNNMKPEEHYQIRYHG